MLEIVDNLLRMNSQADNHRTSADFSYCLSIILFKIISNYHKIGKKKPVSGELLF